MSLNQIIGSSPWTCSLRERIQQAAQFSSNVLITGPSGTGKELIARAVHAHSARSAGPFVPVDCTALSGELFASHLFGHVKGAFTGADYERLGCFRAAEGGTILLDEIGELSADLQSKLLRAIQERVVVPVGSERPVPVNVRLIAATNRDLSEEVRAGRFRLDLFYRLNVVAVQTRALCERADEIAALAEHFLEKLAADQGLPRRRFTPAALAALRAYAWPGNVRELQNVVERAVVFSTGDTIDAEALELDAALPQPRPAPRGAIESVPQPGDASWLTLADVEREHIRVTLARTRFNQSAAAQLLHVDRASLARKMRRFHIALPQPRRGRPSKSRLTPPCLSN